MTQTFSSYVAIVLEGGLVQSIIIEGWPSDMALPRIVVVDYDSEGADDDEITTIEIGEDVYEAVCHCEEPARYEQVDPALSPKAVMASLGILEAGPS